MQIHPSVKTSFTFLIRNDVKNITNSETINLYLQSQYTALYADAAFTVLVL